MNTAWRKKFYASRPPPKLVMLTRETNTIILRQLLNIGECSLLSKKDEPSVYLEPALMACQQGIFFASPLIQRTISVHGVLKKRVIVH